MNLLSYLIFFSFAFTFVVCDRSADIECITKGTNGLTGLSDRELFDLSQQNFEIGEQMVTRRAAIAHKSGLICYKQFYDKYTKGLADIFKGSQEEKRLSAAESREEMSGAIKAIAVITEVMRCDEDWRALHFNETVKEAECSAMERLPYALNFLNFKPKLMLLQTGLRLGQFGAKLRNNVMSDIIGEISELYGDLYTEGESCARDLTESADSCRNLKMFVSELDRLYYLFSIQIQAKFFS